jgi:hypothetical protein
MDHLRARVQGPAANDHGAGRYTELFFLDEAVSLAAGHRPCAECRRDRFNAFKQAWIRSGAHREDSFLYADRLDEELHRARIDRAKAKVTCRAPIASLPDGCFVEIGGFSWLVGNTACFDGPRSATWKRWSVLRIGLLLS